MPSVWMQSGPEALIFIEDERIRRVRQSESADSPASVRWFLLVRAGRTN